MKLLSVDVSNFYIQTDQHIPLLSQLLLDRLKLWNPDLDTSQLKIISFQYEVWNNGALGVPMPGHYYTQALVPGFRMMLESGNGSFEVHTNYAQNSFAIPGHGLI